MAALFVVLASCVDFCLVAGAVLASATGVCFLEVIGSALPLGVCFLALAVAAIGGGSNYIGSGFRQTVLNLLLWRLN